MQLSTRTIRSAHTRATPEQAYALLSDVRRSVSQFPDLDVIRPESGDLYLWRMRKVGAGPLSFQSEYQARFSFAPADRSVRWESVPGRGNTIVQGEWRVAAVPTGSELTLDIRFAVELPVPALLKGFAEATMKRENDRMIGQYLTNLLALLANPLPPA